MAFDFIASLATVSFYALDKHAARKGSFSGSRLPWNIATSIWLLIPAGTGLLDATMKTMAGFVQDAL